MNNVDTIAYSLSCHGTTPSVNQLISAFHFTPSLFGCAFFLSVFFFVVLCADGEKVLIYGKQHASWRCAGWLCCVRRNVILMKPRICSWNPSLIEYDGSWMGSCFSSWCTAGQNLVCDGQIIARSRNSSNCTLVLCILFTTKGNKVVLITLTRALLSD